MKIEDRFLRYVGYDTQSSEANAGSCPSTEKQLTLARYLRDELLALGLSDAEMDSHGYVYATLPSNSNKDSVPTIGFIAHMDTSPDCSGADIKPSIIRDYDGRDIVLDQAEGIVTRVRQFSELLTHKGEDLIVTDGHTLLGADDKAGIAEIVSAVEYLLCHPEVRHGTVRIAFTPDEEIGQGATLFDVGKFACQWAYTMDGGEVGELEYENFNAAHATVTISGRNVHPGYAKGKMLNAGLIAAEFAMSLPVSERPETTEGREGFFHLCSISGGVEEAQLSYIIRDHDSAIFARRKSAIAAVADELNGKYGAKVVSVRVRDQYFNMVSQLADKPHIIDIARRAITEACGTCLERPIRGGTDGARLSFRGLPCPNIFAGGLFFHGRHEVVPIQSMQKAMQTIVNICRITEERA
ncbi:MAG: peptidase T [Prevotellaceae bacterium]|nr:peptidase T [Prevotellaceae bacterium]